MEELNEARLWAIFYYRKYLALARKIAELEAVAERPLQTGSHEADVADGFWRGMIRAMVRDDPF